MKDAIIPICPIHSLHFIEDKDLIVDSPELKEKMVTQCLIEKGLCKLDHKETRSKGIVKAWKEGKN